MTASDDAGVVGRRRLALVAAGLDPDLAVIRGPSFANEVWIGDELVIRINHAGQIGGDPERMLREAAIAARLPREARYPDVLDAGRNGDLAWIVTRRAPGVALGRAWAAMRPTEHERAIVELAEALDALHGVDIGALDAFDLEPPHTLPLGPLLALIDAVIADGADPGLLGDVAALVRARWDAFDDTGRGLVHGDPHFENAMWDGAQLSALLDLEWSRRSWLACDLEILLAIADHPATFAAADYAHTVAATDYAAIPRWLAAARPGWFTDPRLLDRLEVLHVSRTLGALHEQPGSALRLGHLRAVLAGTSYLRRQLAAMR